MKILHHNDPDGWVAGFWVSFFFRDKNPDDFIEMTYDKPREYWFDKIAKNELVYIVDFSIEPKDMDVLLEKTPSVVWIDHHKSAIEKYENYPKKIAGLRSTEAAACMLTYHYLNGMDRKDSSKLDPNKPCTYDHATEMFAPMFTQLVADHDAWIFKYGDITRNWKLGLDTFGHLHPYSPLWMDLLKHGDLVDEICQKGKTIREYRDVLGERACKSSGFEVQFQGKKIFALNSAQRGSEWFGDRINHYDAVCPFNFNGEKWTYSFYSTKEDVDCSALASQYPKKISGGGHKGAAGLVADHYIFTEENKEG